VVEVEINKNNLGKSVAVIDPENVVAIVDGESVQINQLDPFEKDPFKYSSVFMTKEQILKLAEAIQKGEL
jgi:hypothetical protein